MATEMNDDERAQYRYSVYAEIAKLLNSANLFEEEVAVIYAHLVGEWIAGFDDSVARRESLIAFIKNVARVESIQRAACPPVSDTVQ